MWVFALVDIAAGEGPVVALRGFDEQHVAGRVSDGRRGFGVEGSQVGVPRGGLRRGHLGDGSAQRYASSGIVDGDLSSYW